MANKQEQLIEEIIAITKKHHLTADDLNDEAMCVEECGEWTHMCLLGYSAEELTKAADELAKAEKKK